MLIPFEKNGGEVIKGKFVKRRLHSSHDLSVCFRIRYSGIG